MDPGQNGGELNPPASDVSVPGVDTSDTGVSDTGVSDTGVLDTDKFIKKIKLYQAVKKHIDAIIDNIQKIVRDENNAKLKNIMEAISMLGILCDNVASDVGKINKSAPSGTKMIHLLSEVYVYNRQFNMIFKNMCDLINKILDKHVNVETFLSQTYMNETTELYSKIKIHIHKFDVDAAHMDAINDKMIVDHILGIYEHALEQSGPDGIQQVYDTLVLPISGDLYTMDLFSAVTARILHKYRHKNKAEYFRILAAVEPIKDALLNKNSKNITLDTQKNPYFKSFGLVPITDNFSIGQVSNIIFKKDVGDVGAFAELCREKKYDLVLITKHSPILVDYKIMDLLDFGKSKEFDIMNKKDDGINSDIAKRNETIFYVKDVQKSTKWDNDYKFLVNDDDNEFVIILESNVVDKYHIMSNYFNPKVHFIRKSQLIELIEFIKCKKTSVEPSRLDNYNGDINYYICNNMFLSIKPNVDDLKIKATVMDPKYIRNSIFINMISAYKKKYKSKTSDLQSFNALVHDDVFIDIFQNTIMNEYTGYLIKNMDAYAAEYVNVSEIYMSFLPVIDRYTKDLKKKIHDRFTLLYSSFDMNIFKMSDIDRASNLERIFTETIKDVLSSVITLNSNMFQSLIYKVMLFKLSIIN